MPLFHIFQRIFLSIFCLQLYSTTMIAEVTYVTSQLEFIMAHNGATMNDSIIWRSGVYPDIYMNISKDHLFIAAETLGSTTFTGAARVNITSDYVTLKGFQFLDGDIGTSDVINTTGSYNTFTQLNIRAYTCYKYLRVREESQFTEITYCNFENRLNLDDQNILSILVDETNPGYHKIQYCSFKNFDGTGNDLGIEPIRIGLSTQADRISRSLVEYCYFTQCNGDGELISSKATQTVYRFNTFENNPLAELVLRHGSEAIVYGNFFLNGKGGVRVREGQNHYIYNNYFSGLDDRSINLQNRDSDPLDSIHIAFNTIVGCDKVILGGDGDDKPTHVTFANNIFSEPLDGLFEDPTGTEAWISNVAFGNLGMAMPATGIMIVDPLFEENSAGFLGLTEGSPAINAALPGYALLPQFEGMDTIDTALMFDLLGQDRPAIIEEKDLGCTEYPHDRLIQPLATEENTGPSYNTSATTSTHDKTLIVDDLISINPNPVSDQLTITIHSGSTIDLKLDLINFEGRSIDTLAEQSILSREVTITKDLGELPTGVYTIRALSSDHQDGVKRMQSIKFAKVQ